MNAHLLDKRNINAYCVNMFYDCNLYNSFSEFSPISSSMDIRNQNSLHQINLQDNGSMYPLPLSSSSSTSSEITESSATHGASQGSYLYPSKMSTTSISSDASLSSNDNTATNLRHNNQISAQLSVNVKNLPMQNNSIDENTKQQEMRQQGSSTINMSSAIGDSLISQAISGIISSLSRLCNIMTRIKSIFCKTL